MVAAAAYGSFPARGWMGAAAGVYTTGVVTMDLCAA